MATRFRLTASTTAPDISPALQSYSHNAPTTVRRQLIDKGNGTSDSSALTTTAYTPDGSDHLVAGDALHGQLVSNPMAAGVTFTNAQTIKMVAQILEANAANNLFLQLFVSVVSEDGTTVRRTLRSKNSDATEAATSLTSRFHTPSQDGATYVTVDGDRLVVELGLNGTPTAAGGTQGHNGSLRWGSDGAGGDLLENDTQTGTTLNGWIEFVPTITWLVKAGTIASTLALTAPTLAYEVTAGTIASTTSINPPTVAYAITTGTIGGAVSVARVSDGNGYTDTPVANNDFSSFLNASGADALFVGTVTSDQFSTETAIWDQGGTNQSIPELGSAFDITGGVGRLRLFGVVAPTQVTGTLRITNSGSAHELFVFALAVSGAHQAGGTTTFELATNNQGTGTTSTITINSATGNMTVDMTSGPQVQSAPTQTSIFVNNSGNTTSAGASRAGGASSNTHEWTFASSVNWGARGVSIVAAASGGATLFAPTVAHSAGGDQSVTGGIIASGSALSAPTVAYVIEAGTVASTTVLNAPTLAYAVTTGTITGGTQNAPSVAYEVNAPTIASTTTLFAPTLAAVVITGFIPPYAPVVDIPSPNSGSSVGTAAYPGQAFTADRPFFAFEFNLSSSAINDPDQIITLKIWSDITAPGVLVTSGTMTVESVTSTPTWFRIILDDEVPAGSYWWSLQSTADPADVDTVFQDGDGSLYPGHSAYQIFGTTWSEQSTWDFLFRTITKQTFEPTVSPGPVTVTGGTISSTLALNPPDVAHVVTSATIASTLTMSQPEVAYAVTNGTVAATTTTTAPTLAYEINGSAIASTVAATAPSVTVGDVTVVGGTVASTLAVNEPLVSTGGIAIVTGTLASTVALFAPTVTPGAVTVEGATIASTLLLTPPTITADQAATGATIASTLALTPPTVSVGGTDITTGTVTSTLTLASPTVTVGDVTVTGGTVSSTLALTPPTVTPGEVTVPAGTILSTVVLNPPNVEVGALTITLATVASTLTVNPPSVTVGDVSINVGTIVATSVVFPPVVSLRIKPIRLVASNETLRTHSSTSTLRSVRVTETLTSISIVES